MLNDPIQKKLNHFFPNNLKTTKLTSSSSIFVHLTIQLIVLYEIRPISVIKIKDRQNPAV